MDKKIHKILIEHDGQERWVECTLEQLERTQRLAATIGTPITVVWDHTAAWEGVYAE